MFPVGDKLKSQIFKFLSLTELWVKRTNFKALHCISWKKGTKQRILDRNVKLLYYDYLMKK